jgi:hypothetical protein
MTNVKKRMDKERRKKTQTMSQILRKGETTKKFQEFQDFKKNLPERKQGRTTKKLILRKVVPKKFHTIKPIHNIVKA